MRFTQSYLDELRDRLPVSQVIAPHVNWDRRKSQPARGDYWACCPFHQEKTPSFHADDRSGLYYCFGCGESGDAIKFVREKTGLSFAEAVTQLAQTAGMPLPERDPQAQAKEDARRDLYDVLDMAARFFRDALQDAQGAACRGYLTKRGITPQDIAAFRLGYAPDARSALKGHLGANNVTPAQMEATGLVVSGPDIAVSYDRYRNRLIFPIEDARGRVIAFGGRALSADVPAKYINSPQTQLFDKSRVLYNLKNARQAAHEGAPLVVVEGYMDVIASVGAGMSATVAPLGTSLTREQLALMWRFCDEPVLCFDGDGAGRKAAGRAADMALPLLAPGKSVTFCLLPEGLDPDDVITRHGADAYGELIARAQSLHEMIWSREANSAVVETPEQRAALEARLGAITNSIADASVRRHYAQAFRLRLEQFFSDGTPSHAPQRRSYGRRGHDEKSRRMPVVASNALKNSPLVSRAKTVASPREVILLATLINHPGLIDDYLEEIAAVDFSHPPLYAFRDALIDVCSDAPLSAEDVRKALEKKGFSDLMDAFDDVISRHGIWQARAQASDADALAGWRQALSLHRRANSLHKELSGAKKALELELTNENLARLQDIKNQLNAMQGIEALIEDFGTASGKSDLLR